MTLRNLKDKLGWTETLKTLFPIKRINERWVIMIPCFCNGEFHMRSLNRYKEGL